MLCFMSTLSNLKLTSWKLLNCEELSNIKKTHRKDEKTKFSAENIFETPSIFQDVEMETRLKLLVAEISAEKSPRCWTVRLEIRESLLKTLNTYNVHTLGVFRRRWNAIIRDPSTEITSSEPARGFIYASARSSFANEFNLNINYSLTTNLSFARYYYA